jgi:hypothetical protein
MGTVAEQIIKLLEHNPGLTDREITDSLCGHSDNQQPINQKCHDLQGRDILVRRRRSDGLIGNYLAPKSVNPDSIHRSESVHKPPDDNLSENDVKQFLEKWLIGDGWQVEIAWGLKPGVDIKANKGCELWLIEVKGGGSRSAMRVNYFLAALGELLQRMEKPNAFYSIAFPDMQQFRRLWERLPVLAKDRTKISALFVDKNGIVVRL